VVEQDVGALRRHIALIGFMGAGKSTIGRDVARLTQRRFVDLDEEIERRHGPIAKIFDERGEPEFRRIEEEMAAGVLAAHELSVIALGGGAVGSTKTQDLLRARALTIWVPVDVETAWRRAKDSDRPLARDEGRFRALYEEREEIYDIVADASAADAEAVLLESSRIDFRVGALALLGKYVESPRAVLVVDERVLSLHPVKWNAPWVELQGTYTVPPGEDAKAVAVVERLWHEISLDREGTIVALGGGSTTDVAGFTAATYLRGLRWIAVPTTVVGQVDASIGGKTGIDLFTGKNLAGAFHFPERVVIDANVLSTLPEEERRAGMAEVVKTGLLAGRDVWSLPEEDMLRACAAFKSAVVLSDPYERGRRKILNLGHTFAHALETGSGYTVRHGDAVALGLVAALRLSGQPTDVVEEVLKPQPVRADRDAAWAALKRDKKGEGVFVLLEAPGRPVVTNVPDEDARKALDELIAK
jgi:shikimate kinase / 3-dehydroquinate synthase